MRKECILLCGSRSEGGRLTSCCCASKAPKRSLEDLLPIRLPCELGPRVPPWTCPRERSSLGPQCQKLKAFSFQPPCAQSPAGAVDPAHSLPSSPLWRGRSSPADPERCSVRASLSPRRSLRGSGRKAPPPPVWEQPDKGRCGQAAKDPSSKHLPVRRALDPSVLPGQSGAGASRCSRADGAGIGQDRPSPPPAERTSVPQSAVLGRVSEKGQGPRPRGVPKRRDFCGKGKQDFVAWLGDEAGIWSEVPPGADGSPSGAGTEKLGKP